MLLTLILSLVLYVTPPAAYDPQDTKILLSQADSLLELGKYTDALKIAKRVEQIANIEDDNLSRLNAWGIMSLAYTELGDYTSGADYCFKCYSGNNRHQDLRTLAITMRNIAQAYIEAGRYDEAELYINYSLEVENTLKRSGTYAYTLGIAAELKIYQGEFEQAVEIAREAAAYAVQSNNYNILGTAFRVMAKGYFGLEKYELAWEYCDKAMKELTSTKGVNFIQIPILYQQMGEFAYTLGELDKAVLYYDKAVSYANVYTSIQALIECYEKLGEILEIQGSPRAAEIKKKASDMRYMKYAVKVSNSITLHAVEMKALQKEEQYVAQQKQAELSRVLSIYMAVIIVLMGLIMIILSIYFYQISQYNKRLKRAGELKDKFFQIISHDLRSPAVAHQTAMHMLLDDGKTMDQERYIDFCKELCTQADTEVDLVNNLLSWAKLQTSQPESVNHVRFDLGEAIQEAWAPLRQAAQFKGVNVTVDAPMDEIYIVSNRNMLMTVVRNLTSNAIKFTRSGGDIHIWMERIPGKKVRISVRDTGVGMSPEDIEKLFNIGSKLQKPGTDGEVGSGLGLSVCTEIIRLLGGERFVTSEKGKGSTFYLELTETTGKYGKNRNR